MILLLATACLNSGKIQSLDVASEQGVIAMCPGQAMTLQVNATLQDGSLKSTAARGRANLNWKHVQMRFNGQAASEQVFMPLDPAQSWERPLPLKVWLTERPDLVWEGQVVARYDCDYVVDLRGRPGLDGAYAGNGDGSDGDDGASSTGSRGEAGQDGQDGRDGQDGGKGEPGAQAKLYLVPSTTAPGLLEAQVQVNGGQQSWIYLMTPGASSLLLDVSGGQGGSGANGNDGGDGGRGGSGVERTGPGGDGGRGGNGGDAGDAGDGGSAELIVDPSAKEWSGSVRMVARAGPTGVPGEPGYGGQGGDGDPVGADGKDGRMGKEGRVGWDGEVLPVHVTTVEPRF